MQTRQARIAGIVLIVLGIVALFNLWWLVPAALLALGGVVIYQRQRAIGRVGEAVQALLWGMGLAALLLADVIFPGVLILGGVSLLLRGREAGIDARLQTLVARFRRGPAMSAPQSVPPAPVTVIDESERPATNETIRL
ncbi:MAG: hypothetical protein RMK84_17635 [Oscillochloridaceae bacterium]|nr:hypothetical protein [Chloroflexaceae bacterium]MDW8391946.1 hypothetical protein [Oscillochloridaceae bacterium]